MKESVFLSPTFVPPVVNVLPGEVETIENLKEPVLQDSNSDVLVKLNYQTMPGGNQSDDILTQALVLNGCGDKSEDNLNNFSQEYEVVACDANIPNSFDIRNGISVYENTDAKLDSYPENEHATTLNLDDIDEAYSTDGSNSNCGSINSDTIKPTQKSKNKIKIISEEVPAPEQLKEITKMCIPNKKYLIPLTMDTIISGKKCQNDICSNMDIPIYIENVGNITGVNAENFSLETQILTCPELENVNLLQDNQLINIDSSIFLQPQVDSNTSVDNVQIPNIGNTSYSVVDLEQLRPLNDLVQQENKHDLNQITFENECQKSKEIETNNEIVTYNNTVLASLSSTTGEKNKHFHDSLDNFELANISVEDDNLGTILFSAESSFNLMNNTKQISPIDINKNNLEHTNKEVPNHSLGRYRSAIGLDQNCSIEAEIAFTHEITDMQTKTTILQDEICDATNEPHRKKEQQITHATPLIISSDYTQQINKDVKLISTINDKAECTVNCQSNISEDKVKEIAKYLKQFSLYKQKVGKNKKGNGILSPKRGVSKSKLCIQGVEKPGGDIQYEPKFDEQKVQKVYKKRCAPKHLYNQKSPLSSCRHIKNEITCADFTLVEDDDKEKSHNLHKCSLSQEFCFCADFGRLAYYDTDNSYEHIHFWWHRNLKCDVNVLFGMYYEDNMYESCKENTNFETDDTTQLHFNICWHISKCPLDEYDNDQMKDSQICDDNFINNESVQSNTKCHAIQEMNLQNFGNADCRIEDATHLESNYGNEGAVPIGDNFDIETVIEVQNEINDTLNSLAQTLVSIKLNKRIKASFVCIKNHKFLILFFIFLFYLVLFYRKAMIQIILK